MAKNTFLDWDQTASNNTDIGGIGIQGTNAVSNFDDALRTVMAQLRAGVDGEVTYITKSANYTAVLNDNNGFLRCSAAMTLSLTAAATLGANWHIKVVADGGDVIVDPNAAELIDGAATITIKNGYTADIVCTGSAFFSDKMQATVTNAITAVSALAPAGHIFGLTLTNNATDAANDIDISAGSCASDVSTYYSMQLASALTKRIDASWAVGSGNGGLDTGAVGNNIYYVWLIQRSDTGVVDALFSLSSTSPTMPTNYDRKRAIGSFARISATNNAARSYSQVQPTQWVSYTPTFNGIGTATGIKCRSRRVGSNLEVESAFTTGTVTATTFDMSMGFNGVNGVVVCDTFWNTFRPLVGNAVQQVAGPIALYILGLGNSNVVNLSFSSSGRDGLTPVAGTVLGSSIPHMIRFSIPIEGWNVAL